MAASSYPSSLLDVPSFDARTRDFWRVVRKLPDGWHVWISLRSKDNGHDFLLVNNYPQATDRCIFVTHVANSIQVSGAIGGLQHTKKTYAGCTPVLASLTLGMDSISDDEKNSLNKDGIPFWDFSQPSSDLEGALLSACSSLPPVPISPENFEALRAYIAPEVVIPPENAAQHTKPDPNIIAANILDCLQEDILKHNLILSNEGQEVISETDKQHLLVTGVAGSGKSLLLLHKAILLSELNPESNCLILTFNQPLADELDERFERLLADERHGRTDALKKLKDDCPVAIMTFSKWCFKQLKNHYELKLDPKGRVTKGEKENLIQNVIGEITSNPQKQLPDKELLADEFSWIKDNLLRDNYLTSDRGDRGFKLNKEEQIIVHEAFTCYNDMLKKGNKYDWDDVPALLWEQVQKENKLFTYDAILVDETQLLPRVAFKLLQKALEPNGQLLFVADQTQGFLGRRTPVICKEIPDITTKHLSKNYRSTRKICEFATSFYKNRISEPSLNDSLASPDDCPYDSDIPSVKIIPVEYPQHESAILLKVLNELEEQTEGGAKPEDFLIIHEGFRELPKYLKDNLKDNLKEKIIDLKQKSKGSEKQGIRVCPLGRSAGLESPIVFILGIDKLLEDECDIRFIDNTKRLYMAFNRAVSGLVIFLPKKYENHSWFNHNLPQNSH
jgi:hypothetical protein